VLNCALPGIATTQQRDILKEHIDRLQPDRIVVGFCLNDTQPRSQYDSVERDAFERRFGPAMNALSRWLRGVRLSRTDRLTQHAIYRSAEVAGVLPRWQVALQRTYEKDSVEWKDFERALQDIKAMSDAAQLAPPLFSVLNQGTYIDRPTDYRKPDRELKIFLAWYAQAAAAAAAIGFRTYNHAREIAEQLPNEILAVNTDDGHPSARLNQVYARKLFDMIIRDLQAEN